MKYFDDTEYGCLYVQYFDDTLILMECRTKPNCNFLSTSMLVLQTDIFFYVSLGPYFVHRLRL